MRLEIYQKRLEIQDKTKRTGQMRKNQLQKK